MKVYKVLIEYEDGTSEYLKKFKNGNSVYVTFHTAKNALKGFKYSNTAMNNADKKNKKATSFTICEYECLNPVAIYKE